MPLSKPKPRRRLSMTPLIDIIFLLLLFFMLTSTFTRFSEIPLVQGGSGAAQAQDRPDLTFFLRLTKAGISLNGQSVPPENLMVTVTGELGDETNVAALLSVAEEVDAQAFVETLAVLQSFPVLEVTVIQ